MKRREEQSVSSSSSSTGQGESAQSQSLKRKAGRKKFQETRHPVYKGVRRRNGKWVSELRHPNDQTRVWLGTFSSPAMAARAYDAAALALKGDSASFNFPDSASSLPRARSSCLRDIQLAALEAAEKFAAIDDDHDEEDIIKTPTSPPPSASLQPLPLPCSENIGGVFMDEEEVFNMPGILDSMAEGLILSPPTMQKGYYWDDDDDDDVHDSVEFTLWGG